MRYTAILTGILISNSELILVPLDRPGIADPKPRNDELKHEAAFIRSVV